MTTWPFPDLTVREWAIFEVFRSDPAQALSPDHIRDKLRLSRRPLQQIKNLALYGMIDWTDRDEVIGRVSARGLEIAAQMDAVAAQQAVDDAALRGDANTTHDDITPYQLATLRAMATRPEHKWRAEDIAAYMADQLVPPRPTLRRLVWKGLICTECVQPLADRAFWLTQEGMIRATGEVVTQLPRGPSYESAAHLHPSLSSGAFSMLRAMVSSEHKRWSFDELDSVMPRDLDPTSAAAQELYDKGLAQSDGTQVWLTAEGFKVTTGRVHPTLTTSRPIGSHARSSSNTAQQTSTPAPTLTQTHSRWPIVFLSIAVGVVMLVFASGLVRSCVSAFSR